jgi:glycosyltransferase involved in cell wall biosynthesis
VIEHGIVDPGYRYTGELARAAVAVNEAARRGRMAGTDLLPRFSSVLPVDLFAPPQSHFHHELPKRRVYLHPMRWASLGLALIEAMQLGMPVVALATTETVEAVPSGCGVISTDVERLCHALRRYAGDADAARADGLRARAYACGRYGLERFLRAWNALFDEVTA